MTTTSGGGVSSPHDTAGDAETTAAPPMRHTPRRGRRSTVSSLRRLVPYARPAAPAMLISTVAAGVSTVCSLLFPLVIGHIVDGPIAHGDLAGLAWPGTALLALGIGEAALMFVRRIVIARPAMQVEATMRDDLYAKLQRLPVAFHDRWPAGQLLSRAVSDMATIRRFVAFALIFLIVNCLTFIIGVVILLALNVKLGLVVAALAVPLVACSVLFESRYRALSRSAQDQVGDLTTLVEESVLGIRIVKAFGRSAALSGQFRRAADQLRATNLHKGRVLAWLWVAITALPEAALGIVLLLGIRDVAAGGLSAGVLVAFFGVAMTLRWPVESIGWLLAVGNETAAATDRVFEVLDAPEPLRSPIEPANAGPQRGELRLADVHFAYPDGDDRRPVLRGLDLHLSPGETVALVGATGSGKTTIVSLIPRLYDVTSGAITVNGVDIRDLALPDLRRRVAVAFEEPILLSASVRENVLMGYPDATDDAVARALAVSQAEFCYDLPWGLDTRIGEQGLSLSGGQRQRLALARAVVGRPELLVLDDPLSALDIHTEATVERALRSVLESTTALVVGTAPPPYCLPTVWHCCGTGGSSQPGATAS